MLVEGMTYDERYTELVEDYHEISPWIQKQKKQEKRRLEKRRFVGSSVLKLERTSKQGNTWSVWIRIDMKHKAREYTTLFTKMQSRYGVHFFSVKRAEGITGVMEIKPHVIKRIRERFKGEVEDNAEDLVHTLFKPNECVVCAKANDRTIFRDFEAMHDTSKYETLVACFSLGSFVVSLQRNDYFLIRTFMDYNMMLGSRNREIFSFVSNVYVRRNPELFSTNKFKAAGFYLSNMDSFYRVKFPPAIIFFPFAPRFTERPKDISQDDWRIIRQAMLVQYMFGTSVKDAVTISEELMTSGGYVNTRIEKILENYGYMYVRRADGKTVFSAHVYSGNGLDRAMD